METAPKRGRLDKSGSSEGGGRGSGLGGECMVLDQEEGIEAKTWGVGMALGAVTPWSLGEDTGCMGRCKGEEGDSE